MTTDPGFFTIDLHQVGLVAADLEGLVGTGGGVVGEVGALLLGGGEYAEIGSLVCSADHELHSTLMDALTRGLEFFGGLNGALRCCASDYATLDSLVADGFGGKATPAVPARGSDPAAVRRWWDGLGDDQRTALLATDPAEVGALDGVPAADRDIANRAVLSDLWSPWSPASAPTCQCSTSTSTPPPPTASWPRRTTRTPATPPPRWRGWTTTRRRPSVPAALFSGPAEAGGSTLDHFQQGLYATHDPADPMHTTVIGHSYGTTVVGEASQAPGGLRADDVVLAASPGVNVDDAAAMHATGGPAHVWATRDGHDPIVWAEGFHDTDPVPPAFGAHVFDAGADRAPGRALVLLRSVLAGDGELRADRHRTLCAGDGAPAAGSGAGAAVHRGLTGPEHRPRFIAD